MWGLEYEALSEGYADSARVHYEELLALAPEAGDPGMIAWAQNTLAVICTNEGDDGQARVLLRESLQRFQSIGHQYGAMRALYALGLITWRQGDSQRATATPPPAAPSGCIR